MTTRIYKTKQWNIYMIFFAFVLLFAFFVPTASALAAETGLVPNCGLQCDICQLLKLFQNVINFVIFRLAPLFATVLFLAAGVMIMFGGAQPEMLARCKTIFKDTVIGLVIIYSAFLLTNFIIVSLVKNRNVSTDWFKIECTSNFNIPATLEESRRGLLPPGAIGEPDAIERNIRAELQSAGITSFGLPDCQTGARPCGSFAGIQQSVIDEIAALRKVCSSCEIVANDATGPGHTPGSDHENGTKIDLQPTAELNRYIFENFTRSGTRSSDGATLYTNPSTGAVYAFEDNPRHWDIYAP